MKHDFQGIYALPQSQQKRRFDMPKPSQSRERECDMLPKQLDLLQRSERYPTSHTHIQWLLARLGRKVGYRVWVASNDHNKVWNQERLGDLSLKTLPPLANA